MPVPVHAEVTGTKELLAKLHELSGKQQRAALRSGLRKGGQVVLAEAKRRAPGKRIPKALAVKVSVTSSESYVKIGPKRRAGARHAHLVEKGVGPHVIRARKKPRLRVENTRPLQVKHPGMAAQPFLEPGFQATKQQALERIKEAMSAEIEKLAGK